jgi:hypothetical protein
MGVASKIFVRAQVRGSSEIPLPQILHPPLILHVGGSTKSSAVSSRRQSSFKILSNAHHQLLLFCVMTITQ